MNSSGRSRDVTSPGTPPARQVPRASWPQVLLWLCRRLRRFRVSGRSMLPVLAPDDEVLVNPRAKVSVGDVVVARHPYRSDVRVIKVLVGLDQAGRAQLQGSNPAESTDSRTQGSVPMELIIGRVICRLSRQ